MGQSIGIEDTRIDDFVGGFYIQEAKTEKCLSF